MFFGVRSFLSMQTTFSFLSSKWIRLAFHKVSKFTRGSFCICDRNRNYIFSIFSKEKNINLRAKNHILVPFCSRIFHHSLLSWTPCRRDPCVLAQSFRRQPCWRERISGSDPGGWVGGPHFLSGLCFLTDGQCSVVGNLLLPSLCLPYPGGLLRLTVSQQKLLCLQVAFHIALGHTDEKRD